MGQGAVVRALHGGLVVLADAVATARREAVLRAGAVLLSGLAEPVAARGPGAVLEAGEHVLPGVACSVAALFQCNVSCRWLPCHRPESQLDELLGAVALETKIEWIYFRERVEKHEA